MGGDCERASRIELTRIGERDDSGVDDGVDVGVWEAREFPQLWSGRGTIVGVGVRRLSTACS